MGDALADPNESANLRGICTFWSATLENESFPVKDEVLERGEPNVVSRFGKDRSEEI